MKNNNKKYQLVIKAKNHIIEYDFFLHSSDMQDLIKSCKGRTLKKYVKHVLRCGEFVDDIFYIPSTKECLIAPLKKKEVAFTCAS